MLSFTRAKHAGFVTNPVTFVTGFVFAITHKSMNPESKLPGLRRESEFFESEKKREYFVSEYFQIQDFLMGISVNPKTFYAFASSNQSCISVAKFSR